MYSVESNLLITFSFYHATGKSMEISMCKTGLKPFAFSYFFHATDKSMEISMYKAGPKPFVLFYFYYASGKSMEISM